jgi:hypothetical protein
MAWLSQLTSHLGIELSSDSWVGNSSHWQSLCRQDRSEVAHPSAASGGRMARVSLVWLAVWLGGKADVCAK